MHIADDEPPTRRKHTTIVVYIDILPWLLDWFTGREHAAVAPGPGPDAQRASASTAVSESPVRGVRSLATFSPVNSRT